ncbi:MAG: hypothetical protein ACE5KM_19985, partial [Planctomycetaceae bacterium]
ELGDNRIYPKKPTKPKPKPKTSPKKIVKKPTPKKPPRRLTRLEKLRLEAKKRAEEAAKGTPK